MTGAPVFTISKEFAFSASHILAGLPEGHQCGRLHGHNYVVIIELAGTEVDDRGFVMDYGDLSPLKSFVDDVLDHRHLNDLAPFAGDRNPTAENLAAWIYAKATVEWQWPVSGVGISETPKTWAWYRG